MRQGFRDVDDILGQIIDEQEAAQDAQGSEPDDVATPTVRPKAWFEHRDRRTALTDRMAG